MMTRVTDVVIETLWRMGLEQAAKYVRTEILNDHIAASVTAGKEPNNRIRYRKKEFEA